MPPTSFSNPDTSKTSTACTFMASASTLPAANLATLIDQSTSPNISMSSPVQQTPTSAYFIHQNRKPQSGEEKTVVVLRNKQIKVEETRVRELQLLRKAIEESNKIQAERNQLFGCFWEEKMPKEIDIKLICCKIPLFIVVNKCYY